MAPLTVPAMSELAAGPNSLLSCKLPAVLPTAPVPTPTTPALMRLKLVSELVLLGAVPLDHEKAYPEPTITAGTLAIAQTAAWFETIYVAPERIDMP